MNTHADGQAGHRACKKWQKRVSDHMPVKAG
jgi:hypothetical protein